MNSLWISFLFFYNVQHSLACRFQHKLTYILPTAETTIWLHGICQKCSKYWYANIYRTSGLKKLLQRYLLIKHTGVWWYKVDGDLFKETTRKKTRRMIAAVPAFLCLTFPRNTPLHST